MKKTFTFRTSAVSVTWEALQVHNVAKCQKKKCCFEHFLLATYIFFLYGVFHRVCGISSWWIESATANLERILQPSSIQLPSPSGMIMLLSFVFFVFFETRTHPLKYKTYKCTASTDPHDMFSRLMTNSAASQTRNASKTNKRVESQSGGLYVFNG